MVSSNAGTFTYGFQFLDLGGHHPAPGDTALDVRLDYLLDTVPSNLIDASQGDQVSVFQLVTTPGPAGTFYAGLAKAYSASDLTIISGAQTNFFAPLQDVPRDSSWTRTIDFPSFHPFRSQVHPAAIFENDVAYVSALPGGNAYGLYTGAYPDLAELFAFPEITSREEFTFAYGNPFPWAQTFSSVYSFYGVRYQLPGTQFATTVASQFGTGDDSDRLPEPFVIQLSPPQNFQINGMPATNNLTDISVNPVLSWEAPAIGQASYYSVSVRELYVNGIATRSRTIAIFCTAGNALTIPPGVLETGKTYFFRVFAHNEPGSSIEAAPLLTSFPHSWAPTYSGIETP